MIEPPKFFTDARKDYDLCDLEALSKWTVDLGLHFKTEVRASIERLVDIIGTQEFCEEFYLLYSIIMKQHEKQENNNMISSSYSSGALSKYQDSPGSSSFCNISSSSHMSAISFIVPSKAKLIQTFPSFLYRIPGGEFGTAFSRTSYHKLNRRFSTPNTMSSRTMGWQFKTFPDPYQNNNFKNSAAIPGQNSPALHSKIYSQHHHNSHQKLRNVYSFDTPTTPSASNTTLSTRDDGYESTIKVNMDAFEEDQISQPVFGPRKFTRYSSAPASMDDDDFFLVDDKQ